MTLWELRLDMFSLLDNKGRNKHMKIAKMVALASAGILAAGCAHEEHHAQYDESVTPNANQSSRYNSSQSSGTTAGSSAEADNKLASQVRQSLQQDPQIAPIVSNMQITANNGMVVISGTVQSGEQKRRIESIIVDNPDVAILDDQLRLSAGAMSPTSRPGSGSSNYQNGKTGDPSGGQPANPTVNGGDNSVNSVAPSDVGKTNGARLLNPTSNSTNSPPRIYHDAGNMNNSTNNALNSTSRTNGQSQIYQDQNSQGLNTNGNNKIP